MNQALVNDADDLVEVASITAIVYADIHGGAQIKSICLHSETLCSGVPHHFGLVCIRKY